MAQGDQILAIPTLVRNLPRPIRKIIGNLSNLDRVFVGLDLRAADESVQNIPSPKVKVLEAKA